METDEYVVVIGSAGLDIRARSQEILTDGIPGAGVVRQSVGGVARNIAENLARLEVPTILLTALGHDLSGQRVLRNCRRAGIDCQYLQQIEGERTGTYVALQ
ncbi:MAG TPA: PfkB family carbohydrate kinase, partial [Phototrophicaceae bacterium]|nr:PfkB family carbohydrate kinase [Phototrophicaceae bacterium]